ncbi:hypothetical protein THASP1DRAFT_30807 [Thamnocephalis sphaerospora]|uniref:Tom7-domain-containing protein n=1 Tax=Thamnocephalis sphaerospora TaxID=78915 RepID=A0A4P9XNI1_9FUNG|nr:hypothetical protein THASP1DRAFT_30807 [Thamnocephalis sphaerospora]|eukprot:RKP07382.1 hypothetical protein THASP1DRAFT_30807 [Thamnocephalis sphaerospora]
MKEDTKELIARCFEIAKRVVHFGFVPFILYLGFTRSSPRPSFMRMLNPLA